jgi:hydroxylamine reductase
MGSCGKDPETAALLDLLIHAIRGISVYAHRIARAGLRDPEIDLFVMEALVATVTNTNFAPQRIRLILEQAALVKQSVRESYEKSIRNGMLMAESFNGATDWEPAMHLDELIRQGERVGIEERLRRDGPDLTGLVEMVINGIKGMLLHAYPAALLGEKDAGIMPFVYEALAYLETVGLNNERLLMFAQQCGQMNLRAIELLDRAHTRHFGNPEPTPVRMDPIPGKCILVSGHDLKALDMLLSQTQGSGINVYTHGELLPAHGYPKLRKYMHLVGNFGGTWQDQMREFDTFPGAILMTTNCMQKPKQSYIGRIFTCGSVAWPGVRHISDGVFDPVIKAALTAAGFEESGPRKTLTVGYGHHAVVRFSDKLCEGVRTGAIRRLFIVGGCDSGRTGRNYYTEFVERAPEDTLIMTFGCAKYRFHARAMGSICGIPRLLDCGQCNDSFSAIRIIRSLAEALKCDVNELPLSICVAWYEEKVFALLLTLLSMGIQKIRIGPRLPVFLTPLIFEMLERKYHILTTGNVDLDLDASLSVRDY